MLNRFSSRLTPLAQVFLREKLSGARSYRRIAGYFRSSIFEILHEDLDEIGQIQIICNSELDPHDIKVSRAAREQALNARWNEARVETESLLYRERYRRLYELLTRGNVEVRVVPRDVCAFIHGKAGVIERADGSKTCFMGSVNETREGWSEHYELLWEDTSPEGIAWVEDEFNYLWERGYPLPSVIVEEVRRIYERVEISIEQCTTKALPAAALAEAPIYRGGEQLQPWQRAFVGMFMEHRETYGKARLLLADEVGVGKTLSLAGSALVGSLLGDGPVLILCPATLTQQWQVELCDKLGVPSVVWLSQKKAWQDHHGHLIKTRGPEDMVRCPFQIGIVSTGLIFQGTPEREYLLKRAYGTIILDEAHRARRSGTLGKQAGEPNNLLSFMMEAAKKARHVLLGTGTPIQTEISELWDLLQVLNQGADHVLGRLGSVWKRPEEALKLMTGEENPTGEAHYWDLLRNPLPPKAEDRIFDAIRMDLGINDSAHFTDLPVSDLDRFTREDLADKVAARKEGLTFFQRTNPILRHTVLRKRSTLEDMGLLEKIGVDIHPSRQHEKPFFEGLGLFTNQSFDNAYRAAIEFTALVRQRNKAAGFMKSLMLQRICSSFASGLSTAQRLLEKGLLEDDVDSSELSKLGGFTADERGHLEDIVDALSRAGATDPKFNAVLHYLNNEGWLGLGCIVFSQYFDTANWVAQELARRLPGERIALYAGADRSGFYHSGFFGSVAREEIKKAVRERTVPLVIATDAACEGLNLQTLGTLINIDLPWNPSRLEQRIGRIKRFGQQRPSVDMLNLVYHDTRDEDVYAKLSERMRDRFDLFGALPDVIDDGWIEDIEALDEKLSGYIERKRRANAFKLRYSTTVEPSDNRWELCARVLSRKDIEERLTRAW
ncbi:MAG: phospholipase D-like domain-containing anti-phage protein [Gammaproteobacteria bacterium]